MAFYDWNNDGKIDYHDDLIQDENFKCDGYHFSRGGGISTFGATLATIGGFFLACFILTLLGIAEDTPALGIIIMWIICGSCLAVWFEKIGL